MVARACIFISPKVKAGLLNEFAVSLVFMRPLLKRWDVESWRDG